MWTHKASFKRFEYKKDSVNVPISESVLSSATFSAKGKDLILFCREFFHGKFEFLKTKVLLEGNLGFLYGPPRTTTTAFALPDCCKEYIVTWIHLGPNSTPHCTRITKDSIQTADFSTIANVLEGEGIAVSEHGFIWSRCTSWSLKARTCEERRAVNVSPRRLVAGYRLRSM